MTSPASPPGGGEFFLDTELARAAVDQLRTVYEGLAGLQERAFDVARQPRTAHDPVSVEAFDLLSAKAVGGPGSFSHAVGAAMNHVQALIDGMESDLAQQEEVDRRGARDVGRT